jgi:hypothetical protein
VFVKEGLELFESLAFVVLGDLLLLLELLDDESRLFITRRRISASASKTPCSSPRRAVRS